MNAWLEIVAALQHEELGLYLTNSCMIAEDEPSFILATFCAWQNHLGNRV